jgi:hypothetical protein
MNKKGAELGLGLIFIAFVGVIVGATLFLTIAQDVGTATSTIDIANVSFTSAAEGESVYLTAYKAISDPVIYNATGTLVPAANYTVTNNVIDPTTGGLSVQVTTGDANTYAEDVWNISGTAQPPTYIANAGARSVAGLIVIFFALAVAVIGLTPALRSGVLGMMKK